MSTRPATHRFVRAIACLVLATAATAQSSGHGSDQKHWAYRKPTRPSTPHVNAAHWPQNPIDAFVLEKLEANGMAPSARAERARLLRRVHLDLTGLPPSIEDVDAFLRDDSEGAWQKVADGLLASPRFGEHWARQWLDLARYADSNGFQADQLRDSWAYRDWVIDALNADMPFDRFTIEQIAGDLLPDATLAQRIATGFHRNVTCNVEAGVDPEANRVNQVFDRVNTTATVWLGTTMECAQCHDHKYDPFSQSDYFRLFAFLNNTPIEVKNGQGVRFDFYGPKLELPLASAEREQLAALHTELAEVEARQKSELTNVAEEQLRWEHKMLALLAAENPWHALDVAAFASTGDENHTVLPDKSVLIGGRLPGTATYTVETIAPFEGITAFRIETLTHPSLPGTGPGRGDDKRPNFILSEFTVHAHDGNGQEATRVDLHSAQADYSQRGWHVKNAIDGKQNKGWAIGGGFFKDHYATFQTRTTIGNKSDTRLTFTIDQNYGRGRTIGRFRLSAYTGDPALLALPKQIARILQQEKRGAKAEDRLREYFRNNHPAAVRLTRQVADLKQRVQAIQPATALVMVEEQQPRATHVMQRGDYLQPGARVTAGTPTTLHAFREDWPKNRLGLARWIASPDNPLIARVTANRWWSHIFGRGLVTTEEDFGLRSEAPSHARLLDWLAVEFVESGWSMKHVLRLIVTSATYQQSARRQGAETVDDDNTLLARGPRFRMSAEMIRDNALSIAGLLSLKTSGEPVFPPQPAGLWRQTGRNEPKYVVATNEDRFRRGIYVVWRRAAPYPSFVLFDGPDRSSCHPSRSRTNTPMQALTLMNDDAYVEAALGLALRVVRQSGMSTAARIEHAFRLALARRPTTVEREHLRTVFHRERQRLAADAKRAAMLVDSVKGIRVANHIDRVDAATWFLIATILLNLDETISK